MNKHRQELIKWNKTFNQKTPVTIEEWDRAIRKVFKKFNNKKEMGK